MMMHLPDVKTNSLGGRDQQFKYKAHPQYKSNDAVPMMIGGPARIFLTLRYRSTQIITSSRSNDDKSKSLVRKAMQANQYQRRLSFNWRKLKPLLTHRCCCRNMRTIRCRLAQLKMPTK